MRGQAFGVGDPDGVRRDLGERARLDSHDVHVLLEVGDPQRTRKARGARGGENVVHARDVVAEDRRRVAPDEHRTCVSHFGHEQVGVLTHQLHVFGCDGVDGNDRTVTVVDEHGATAALQRRGRVLASGRCGQLPGQRGVDRVGHRFVPRHDDGTAARTVLGLGEQVGGDEFGIRGGVRDDHHVGRPREAVDADHADELTLRLCDVRVPRTDDHVDGRNRISPVRERGDGLGAADPVELVDVGEGCGGERGVGDAAVGARRDAEHDLGHAGDPRRHGGHQHARRVCRPPAGHVAAGPVDRDHEFLHLDPRPLVGRFLRQLRLVEGEDLVARELERPGQLGIDAGKRGLPLCARDREFVGTEPVEAFGQVAHGVVAPGAHNRKDLPNHGGHIVGLGTRPGERGPQVAFDAADVRASEDSEWP